MPATRSPVRPRAANSSHTPCALRRKVTTRSGHRTRPRIVLTKTPKIRLAERISGVSPSGEEACYEKPLPCGPGTEKLRDWNVRELAMVFERGPSKNCRAGAGRVRHLTG